MSKYDKMTMAYNRQYGLDKAERLMTRHNNSKSSIGLIFCDINGLKIINDEYGHEAEDLLIKVFANSVKKHIRWHNRVFIYEFCFKFIDRIRGKRSDDMIRW